MQIFAAIFAILFSFSQAASLHRVDESPSSPAVTLDYEPSATAMLPDEASDYAENACTSCQKMNDISSAR